MEQGVLLTRLPRSETPISLHPSTHGARGISCQMDTTQHSQSSRCLARCVQLLCCTVEVPLTLARVQDLNMLEVSCFSTEENK